MKLIRNLLLASALLVGAVGPAGAVGSIETVNTIPVSIATYSAAILNLAPAASATDFFTITGSATTVVRVKEAYCTGTSTAAAVDVVQLVMRSTANATGTSTTPTAVPYDSNLPAATAVVRAYTVNPGTLGTLIGPVRVTALATAPLASPALNPTDQTTATGGPNNTFAITLRGNSQVFSFNNNAASFAAGTALSCHVVWTESAT